MGRKTQAAKASLVAAFVAAGGAAATAKAGPAAQAAGSAKSPAGASRAKSFSWGAELVRFLKLDGFPAYYKYDGFANYSKLLSVDQLSQFYDKHRGESDAVLALYQKGGTARGSMLDGILIGLEQYFKYDSSEALQNFLKIDGAQEAYSKFGDFLGLLESDAKDAFTFFYKETGISGTPGFDFTDGGLT